MIKDRLRFLLSDDMVLLYRKFKYSVPNTLCSFFKMRNEIILESHPDLSCNTYELFKYFLSAGTDKKYKLVWAVDGAEKYKNLYPGKNVEFMERYPKGFIDRIKFYFRCNRAKALITCNRHIPKYQTGRKQINVYLDHGSPLKDLRINGHNIRLSCSYIISQAEFFENLLVEQYGVAHNQIKTLGVPRNDQLFGKYDTIGKVIENAGSFDKIIVWVPTFRKLNAGDRIDCTFSQPLGIPIIYSEKELSKCNSYLHEKNTLLLIKPHPAQDLSVVKSFDMSNIKLIYNSDMLEKSIQTNELLAQTDAMITDYSGIYYDYLLLDRPIAITLDDYEQYSEQKGFAFDDPLSILQGEQIRSISDLYLFFDNVSSGKDVKKEARNRIKAKTNTFIDGHSSKRVADFILSKIK